MGKSFRAALPLTIALAAGCGGGRTPVPSAGKAPGTVVVVADTVRPDYFEAAGVATATEHATLSTRLMATVESVGVLEGDQVRAGDVLIRLDASDLDARRRQATAALAEAQAMADLADLTAVRMRALYVDSAAPKAQLDAAENGLARANAGLSAAHAAVAELEATAAYATVRAPFDGVVTRRYVDPGAFAAPGAPLLDVESSGRLRISVSVPADLARGLGRGHAIAASVESAPVEATVEGVVPAGRALYTVNAIVANPGGRYLAGSAATLRIVTGDRRVVLVPSTALLHQGDLVGVRRRLHGSDELTWLRLGGVTGNYTEVLSGLSAGDSVVVPPTGTGAR